MEGDHVDAPARAVPDRPVRVALYDDYELVAAGLRAMLDPHRARVRVLDLGPRAGRPSDLDVVLLDPFTRSSPTVHPEAVAGSSGAPVVLYTWRPAEELQHLTTARGVAGYLPKSAAAGEVVATLEAVHRRVGGPAAARTGDPASAELTSREGEVLGLIARGLSNQAIGTALFLSGNTIKSYIRSAYRKIGVRTRAQAVAWVLQRDRGFTVPLPARSRAVPPSTRGPAAR